MLEISQRSEKGERNAEMPSHVYILSLAPEMREFRELKT